MASFEKIHEMHQEKKIRGVKIKHVFLQTVKMHEMLSFYIIDWNSTVDDLPEVAAPSLSYHSCQSRPTFKAAELKPPHRDCRLVRPKPWK